MGHQDLNRKHVLCHTVLCVGNLRHLSGVVSLQSLSDEGERLLRH
ncbi:mCG148284 [Mus musculus]|nr:mCG148284 [Mus musculus]